MSDFLRSLLWVLSSGIAMFCMIFFVAFAASKLNPNAPDSVISLGVFIGILCVVFGLLGKTI